MLIEGPPGTGKTTVIVNMLISMIASKMLVGILTETNNSLHNILARVDQKCGCLDKRFKVLIMRSKQDKESRGDLPY